ncbi:NAD(P)/FAD-dependent oxidoreductase [Ideonella livida]|uniref:NAD(P)/FAD-dependent oxidoreductase n=1 Tax=Ideonella livida TaxID=2707176 RepID=A0A7C9TJL7_9BURK|nr:NAD(P)/FAD-dependent oxidoreductase [Ideonella livida]NDY90327.1 NAD(P)/FAD-dependent oxidoreductase [Ideonella livida]
MEDVDSLVIGAGVVGLAVARALARQGRETVVVEQALAPGTGVSARSSEVIHAGLHHPAGSLKARLCQRGRQLLYDYCAARGVAHRRCGKLIVATTPAQLPALRQLWAAGQAQGVPGLAWCEGEALRRLEPALRAEAALHSACTGIVDSHGLMQALLADAQAAGAQLALGSPVLGGQVTPQGLVLQIGGAQPMAIRARTVVNGAGLHAPALAARLQGLDPRGLPRSWRAKGHYFSLRGRAPFSRLVYPLPEPGGLGIHLTLDLAGQARFGPDVEWVDDTADLQVDPRRAAAFDTAIRRYWPDLPAGALQPAYAGIRPKISGPGEPAADFMVQGPGAHGVPGLVNLFGIESPGLTSSLALAEEVLRQLAPDRGLAA